MHVPRSHTRASTLLVLLMWGGFASDLAGQAGAEQSGRAPASASAASDATVSGFVRINGDTLRLRYAYAVVAPDTFDKEASVTLLIVSSVRLAPSAIAKASTRRELTNLLSNGAIVELTPTGGHTIFLRHGALHGQEIQTNGRLTLTENTPTRLSGHVVTSSSDEERTLGYAIRFEITFDAPVRTISTLQ